MTLLYLVENCYECKKELFDNVNFPSDTLEKLAEHSKCDIRAGIASSTNTPVYILEKLSTDRKSSIRADVASNANTPKTLTTDKYHTVATAAKTRLQKTNTRSH